MSGLAGVDTLLCDLAERLLRLGGGYATAGRFRIHL